VKMPRTKADKGPPPLEDLPESLRMATVKLMAKYGLDFEAAYEKLAILSDTNSREFDDAVKKRSESLYKSRLMGQMNSARASINNTANAQLKANYDRGYGDGYAKGKGDHQIYFYCNVCGKPVYITPNSNSHQAVVDLMHEKGWGHQACHDNGG